VADPTAAEAYALLAACTENKTIADEQAARTAITKETTEATD